LCISAICAAAPPNDTSPIFKNAPVNSLKDTGAASECAGAAGDDAEGVRVTGDILSGR
jgi:hypothetical protein